MVLAEDMPAARELCGRLALPQSSGTSVRSHGLRGRSADLLVVTARAGATMHAAVAVHQEGARLQDVLRTWKAAGFPDLRPTPMAAEVWASVAVLRACGTLVAVLEP